ncbi:MAG TPA: hypothetical protein VKA00_02690 [Trueperaceae bacterium]|nr:hypothetical protein [Trueperaceae bacterium]
MHVSKRKPPVRALLLSAGLLLVLAFTACSGPIFDPTGSYAGTLTSGGSPVSVTTTITATSTQNTWDFTLVAGTSSYPGTCTHNASGTANNLSCSFFSGGYVLKGTLNGDSFTGDWLAGGSPLGTFSLTRS